MRRTLLLLPLTALLLPLAAPAEAAPSCYDARTSALLCGGRVVAEPEQSTTFQQFDGPVESLAQSLAAIEALAPRYVEVGPVSEFTGDATHRSAGGRELWVARVTDEQVPREGKRQVAASLSVHALEPAGREGGLRWLEDVARAAAALPGTPTTLYAGDVGKPLGEVLAGTETWLAFLNPDGWAAGDLDSTSPGPGFVRGNEAGADLNRDYPTVGWYDRTAGRGVAASEPETRAWIQLVEGFPHLTTSTDVHGELDTPNEAFADLIVPAGQWTPKRQAQVGQLSRHMVRTIERAFDREGVVLDDVFGPLPGGDGATPRRPADVAAAYDIVGYDDSGFMGDWFSQTQDSVHMDVENFLSNAAPNSAFVPLVEQAHVAAVRGILEATVVEALLTGDVRPELRMQRVAYVDDGVRTTSADGTGEGAGTVAGETQVPYDVSRLRYFEVLEQALGKPVDGLPLASVLTADLSGYDSVVVDDTDLPAPALARLAAFARAGGQLVLTDRSVGLAAALGIVAPSAVTLSRANAGHVDFVPGGAYQEGLVGRPSQTYYEVMLGFTATSTAPLHGITRTAWTAAGGTTSATVGDEGAASTSTGLGSVPFGQGKVTIFGAVLPQAVESLPGLVPAGTPHPFGLADFAVTLTGGRVLDNVLAYARPGATAVTPAPSATASATTAASPTGTADAGTTSSASPAAGGPAAPVAVPSPSASSSPSAPPSPSTPPSPSVTTPAPGPSTSPSGAPASAACVTGPVGLPTPTLRSGSSSAVRLAGTPGATVDVVAYTRPSTTYRTVRSVVLPASGRAEVVLRPPSNTRLYARQRGCSAGPSAVLTVTSTLSLDADRTGPRAYRLAGNSLPKRAGGLPVALYRVQADGSEVLTARTRTDPRTGAWSLSRTFSGTGRYGFVLRSSTDVTNAAGASAVRTVVLR